MTNGMRKQTQDVVIFTLIPIPEKNPAPVHVITNSFQTVNRLQRCRTSYINWWCCNQCWGSGQLVFSWWDPEIISTGSISPLTQMLPIAIKISCSYHSKLNVLMSWCDRPQSYKRSLFKPARCQSLLCRGFSCGETLMTHIVLILQGRNCKNTTKNTDHSSATDRMSMSQLKPKPNHSF